MKLLWVKADFLHPTDRGGQIRTLEMLKRLHPRHDIHYVALQRGDPSRSSEYCSHAYPIEHKTPEKNSVAFAAQLAEGLISPLPVAVNRYRSDAMRRAIEDLSRREKFDATVCDFLFPAPNIPDLASCVLFEHNVESIIWERHAGTAPSWLHRWYFAMQARKMEAFERDVCRSVRRVVAVSPVDAGLIRKRFQVERVDAIPTGVDLDYFARPADISRCGDLVFLGSLDWLPNIDGAEWFIRQVLPLIRRKKPDCSLVLAGRKPAASLLKLIKNEPRISATGTVPDIRPYLWGAAVSIVPLRIGGGTRLKIFESMAARTPVVSTTIGAEGLPVHPGSEILLADTPEAFAECCLELLENAGARESLSEAAWNLVASRFSWDSVSRDFERLLQS